MTNPTIASVRDQHCNHPERRWCDCDWCRVCRDLSRAFAALLVTERAFVLSRSREAEATTCAAAVAADNAYRAVCVRIGIDPDVFDDANRADFDAAAREIALC